jgi:hypothetical protein
MPQAQTTKQQHRRTPTLRGVASGLKAQSENPSENLVEFIKVLERVEVTPEKLAFNSKYIRCEDGTIIEY